MKKAKSGIFLALVLLVAWLGLAGCGGGWRRGRYSSVASDAEFHHYRGRYFGHDQPTDFSLADCNLVSAPAAAVT